MDCLQGRLSNNPRHFVQKFVQISIPFHLLFNVFCDSENDKSYLLDQTMSQPCVHQIFCFCFVSLFFKLNYKHKLVSEQIFNGFKGETVFVLVHYCIFSMWNRVHAQKTLCPNIGNRLYKDIILTSNEKSIFTENLKVDFLNGISIIYFSQKIFKKQQVLL